MPRKKVTDVSGNGGIKKKRVSGKRKERDFSSDDEFDFEQENNKKSGKPSAKSGLQPVTVADDVKEKIVGLKTNSFFSVFTILSDYVFLNYFLDFLWSSNGSIYREFKFRILNYDLSTITFRQQVGHLVFFSNVMQDILKVGMVGHFLNPWSVKATFSCGICFCVH